MARGIETDIDLSPRQRVQVAFGYLYLGIDQHLLASLFGVNPGRVNETIKAVRKAVEWDIKSTPQLALEGEPDGASETEGGA